MSFKKVLSLVMAVALLGGCGASSSNAASSNVGASVTEGSVVESTKDEAETVVITDHAGRTVEVKTNPESVVVLDILPLASVLTVYLDGADSIAAMQPASMNAAKNGILSELYPEVLNARTDILNGDAVNVEALLEIAPDVVFYNAGNSSEAQVLENAGLTAVGVSPTKFGYDCIVTYNEWISLLNQIYPERAFVIGDTVNEYAQRIYDEIQEKTAGIEEKTKVLFLFQYDENTMITSGSSFFGQWWCDATGAKNVAEDVKADNSNAVITMEQVYEWDPEVIVITNFTKTQPQDLYDNAIGNDDWSTVKAVMDGRVYKMPLGTYRTYTPGVDTPMTLEWLAQAVYPELFADYDVKADVREYYQTLYGIDLTDAQIDAMYSPNKEAGSLR